MNLKLFSIAIYVQLSYKTFIVIGLKRYKHPAYYIIYIKNDEL